MKKYKKRPKKKDFIFCMDCNYYFEDEPVDLNGSENETTFCMMGDRPIGGRCIFKLTSKGE